MQYNHLNWAKTYDLRHQDGNFDVFVTFNKAGYFSSWIFYYIFNKHNKNPNIARFTLKHELLVSPTENGVYTQCIDWINKNLPGKYNIIEKGIINFQ